MKGLMVFKWPHLRKEPSGQPTCMRAELGEMIALPAIGDPEFFSPGERLSAENPADFPERIKRHYRLNPSDRQ